MRDGFPMNTPRQFFPYCPHCGTPYAAESMPAEGEHQYCSHCGTTVFHNPHPAAGALIFNEQDEVLLARRSVEPRKGDWDVPGGFVDWGEEPMDAVVRELKEEAGVDFTPTGLVGAYHGWYETDGLTISAIGIYYTGTIRGTPIPADDVAEYRWFPVDALPPNLAFDHIQRAITDWKRSLSQ